MSEFSIQKAVRVLDEQLSVLKGLKLLMINIEEGMASNNYRDVEKWDQKKEEMLNLLEAGKKDFEPILKSWSRLEIKERRGMLEGRLGTVLDSIEKISGEIQSNARDINRGGPGGDSDGPSISGRINLSR